MTVTWGVLGKDADALSWMRMAAAMVGVSALFALMIALARVPWIGRAFPGDDFYGLALTMHVTLSQGAWFMAMGVAFAKVATCETSPYFRLPLQWIGAMAVLALIAAFAVGGAHPVLSNYFPVLDAPAYLAAAMIYVGVFAVAQLRLLGGGRKQELSPNAALFRSGMMVFAGQSLAVLALAAHAAIIVGDSLRGLPKFETLFWAAGHAWQYALVTLMMCGWAMLAGETPRRMRRVWFLALVLSALPSFLSVVAAIAHSDPTHAYFSTQTEIMRYLAWPAPTVLAIWLLRNNRAFRTNAGVWTAMLLMATGFVFGALINGSQTTLVTAHYHGTVGAVTLSLMVAAGLWAAGEARSRITSWGAVSYGLGVWLMAIGLAVAGLNGAPRKEPGDVATTRSVEAAARAVLGIGGLAATIGLMGFSWGFLARDGKTGDWTWGRRNAAK